MRRIRFLGSYDQLKIFKSLTPLILIRFDQFKSMLYFSIKVDIDSS